MRVQTIACVLAGVLAITAPKAMAALNWVSSGPGGGGAFATASQSVSGSLIVGADLGGAYRSTDGGTTWSALGLGKGLTSTHVDAVVHHPSIDGTVFLGTFDGLFKSSNCATSPAGACTFTNVLPSTGTQRAFVTAIGIASSGTATATTLYAAGIDGWCDAGPHLWKSTNNGTSWSVMAANGIPSNANIMALRVQPGNAQTVIAISARSRFTTNNCSDTANYPVEAPNRAFISTNGGVDFTPVWISSTDPALLQSDSISPGTWAYVEDVKFDKANASRVWATVTPVPVGSYWAVNGELWMSSGTTGVAQDFQWQSGAHTGQLWTLPTGNVRVIDLRRQHPWDTGEKGVWRWDATAHSWSRMNTDAQFDAWTRGWSGGALTYGGSLNGSLHTITPVTDTTLWWGDSQFAYKTTDGGVTFAQQFANSAGTPPTYTSRKIDNAVPGLLVKSPVANATLFAGYFDMGCWFATNANGAAPAWTDCNGPKSVTANSPWNGSWKGYGGNATGLALDPSTAATLWSVLAPDKNTVGTYKIGKSTDSGATFSDVTYNLATLASSRAITGLIVEAPTASTRRLWTVANNRLFKLGNAATSWTQVVTPCDGGLMIIEKSGSVMLAAGSTGVCRSTDAGATWVRNALGITWPGSPAGTWWQSSGEKLQVSDIAFDPASATTVWLAVYDPSWSTASAKGGLYKSTDSGVTFAQVTSFGTASNFGRNHVRTVTVSPANSSIVVAGRSEALLAGGYRPLLAGNATGGAWVSRDGGATWTNENAGLAWPFITRLRFTGGATPRLYGISPGQGIVYSTTSP